MVRVRRTRKNAQRIRGRTATTANTCAHAFVYTCKTLMQKKKFDTHSPLRDFLSCDSKSIFQRKTTDAFFVSFRFDAFRSTAYEGVDRIAARGRAVFSVFIVVVFEPGFGTSGSGRGGCSSITASNRSGSLDRCRRGRNRPRVNGS